MYRRRVLRTFQRGVDSLFVLWTLLYHPHFTLSPAFYFITRILLYRPHFTLAFYFIARILLYRPLPPPDRLLWALKPLNIFFSLLFLILRALKPIYINVGPETHVHKITNAPVFFMEREVMDFWRQICNTWASFRGGPWILDFFGPWNGTSEGPKKSRIRGPPL